MLVSYSVTVHCWSIVNMVWPCWLVGKADNQKSNKGQPLKYYLTGVLFFNKTCFIKCNFILLCATKLPLDNYQPTKLATSIIKINWHHFLSFIFWKQMNLTNLKIKKKDEFFILVLACISIILLLQQCLSAHNKQIKTSYWNM